MPRWQYTKGMKREQKIVATGAASGVLTMLLLVAGIAYILPDIRILDSFQERLRFALIANVFAIIPLFAMLVVVGNARFLSKAINPLRHAENKVMEIDGRVADNTLQQNFVFLIVSLTAATFVWHEYLNIVWACGIVFAIARMAFWIGYRIDPLYRAAGMAATGYMNLFIIIYILYRVFSS